MLLKHSVWLLLLFVGRLHLEHSSVDNLTPLPVTCSEMPGRVNAAAERLDVSGHVLNYVSRKRPLGLLHPAGGLLIAVTSTLWWSSLNDLLAAVLVGWIGEYFLYISHPMEHLWCCSALTSLPPPWKNFCRCFW